MMFEPNPDMVVWPLAWKPLTPSNKIRLLAMTEEEENICVIITTGFSYILKFDRPVDAVMQEHIKEKFSASSLTPSNMNSHVITVRVDHVVDEEILTAMSGLENIIIDDDCCNSFFRARNISPYKPITISKFAPVSQNFNNCNITISVNESHVLPSDNEIFVARDTLYVEVKKNGDSIEQIITRIFGEDEKFGVHY